MPDAKDAFAEAKLRRKKLQEQFAATPISEVIGVIYAPGTGGGRSGGETLWTLKTSFEAWRVHGGPLQTRPLRITRTVTDDELKDLQKRLPAYSIVRIHARVVKESPFGGPEALLEYIVGPDDSDAELNQFAKNLQKPVTFDDPAFGTFTLDRRVNSFGAKTVWQKKPVKLRLSAKEPAEVQAALKTAKTLWESQSEWDTKVRDFAVQRLLERKNDEWLGEDEDEILPEEFKARMKLQTITVHSDGAFEFWHDDGDLFWGHAIMVSGTLSKGLTNVDTPG